MMQDLPSASNGNNVSGKMDSTTNGGGNNTNQQNDTESQSSLGSLKRYLPIVKYVGSSTKDFFVSGQFKRTIRSPIQFVNPRHLSIPQNFGDALTRLAKNWGFYKSNYAIITFVCCFGWLISSPSSLIVLSILFLIWFYTIKTSNDTLTIGETKYGPMQKYMVAILITLLAMLFFGIISTIIGGLSVGSGISSIHAICHTRPANLDDNTNNIALRNLNDIENENDPILTAAANINLNNLNNNNDNVKSFNGLEIMQMDDNDVNDIESFSVNEVNNNNTNNNNTNNNMNNQENHNNYSNYNNYNDSNQEQTSIFEKPLLNNNNNNNTDDDQPELGSIN